MMRPVNVQLTRQADVRDEELDHVPTDILPQRLTPDLPPERTAARLRALWEQRKTLARSVTVGLVLSILFAFLIPKRYTSTARLMPPDEQSGAGLAMLAALGKGGGGALSTLGSSLLGLKSTSDMFVGVLQSRTVEDDIISKFNLLHVYHDRYPQDARKDLEKLTDISVDRKSGIITIQVTDKDPKRAAEIGQEYVTDLNRLVNQLTTSSAHRERVFLEQRLDQVKTSLEAAEKEFSEFASKNTAINIPEQGKAMIGAAASLEGQLIASQTELESLKQIYTDNNVRVRAVQARVDEIHRQMQKLGGSSASGTSNLGSSQEMYPSIRELPVLGVTYADLYRATKVQEAIFETLTQEYELAKVEEAKEIPVVKVLDFPNVPEKKSFPPRLVIICLGTVFALSLGIAWSFGKQLWEQTDSRDPRKVLAQEVYSTIRGRLPKFASNGQSPRAERSDGDPDS